MKKSERYDSAGNRYTIKPENLVSDAQSEDTYRQLRVHQLIK